MASSSRVLGAVSALAVTALLMVGCTSSPGAEAPTSSDSPAPSGASDDTNEIDATLLDDGRMFAVVTWGSSTCVPDVDAVEAEGQNVGVTLVDGDADQACTADMAPRASIGAFPEGVDPTQPITLDVTYGDVADDVDLDGQPGLSGTPGSPTEFQPSAGWISDGALVLLTWGSSTCPPVVESVEGTGGSGTVTFTTENGMCTMDMAPRATILSFGEGVDEEGFTLTLEGGNLDGTVNMIGD
ncbi:hypothetical protein [Microbacterium sp.]|uniref:hypothetical protein n=1 Tax=Microbacterium sp. TaxID=51671 RepID=UPI00281271F7|nr:hypothetical protein [Microbacterium sp.]